MKSQSELSGKRKLASLGGGGGRKEKCVWANCLASIERL